ncbi:MAG: OmpH family outer membrane protein [Treponema sp.]|nr:OmpH family outer membrane protein [Treponema sp.]
MVIKRFISVLSVLFCFSTVLFAQQITRFGVVDTSRVYQSYYRNSAPVRNYEAKKSEFQNEIKKRTAALRDLQEKKLEYQKNGDDSNVLKVEAQITKDTQYLQEYTTAKNMELESLKASLKNSDEFYQKLYATLAKIAESNGYSMILSLQQTDSVLWYSPSVDITDEVISSLGL